MSAINRVVEFAKEGLDWGEYEGDNVALANEALQELAALQNELEFFRETFPNAAKNYRKVMDKMKEIENG